MAAPALDLRPQPQPQPPHPPPPLASSFNFLKNFFVAPVGLTKRPLKSHKNVRWRRQIKNYKNMPWGADSGEGQLKAARGEGVLWYRGIWGKGV